MRPANTSQIIVNGDDFGYDAQTNEAILKSFERGYISSTTIMVNMPGFEQACELAHTKKLLSHIGLHLNLTEGTPLTGNIISYARFCSEHGNFIDPRKRKRFVPLNRMEEQALREEIVAQINAARKNGIPLTHLDSHNHVHTFWSIGSVVLQVARQMGINYIRLSPNCGKHMGFIKRIYKTFYNQWLWTYGMAAVHYFGNVDDFLWLLSHRKVWPRFSAEIMCHPKIGSDAVVWESRLCKPLGEYIGRLSLPLDLITSYNGQSYLDQ